MKILKVKVTSWRPCKIETSTILWDGGSITNEMHFFFLYLWVVTTLNDRPFIADSWDVLCSSPYTLQLWKIMALIGYIEVVFIVMNGGSYMEFMSNLWENSISTWTMLLLSNYIAYIHIVPINSRIFRVYLLSFTLIVHASWFFRAIRDRLD